MGGAWQEAKLLRYAYDLEQELMAHQQPQHLRQVPECASHYRQIMDPERWAPEGRGGLPELRLYFALCPRKLAGELVSGRRGSLAGSDGAPNPGEGEQGQSGDPCAEAERP